YAVVRYGALFRGRDRQKDQSYFLWGIDRAVVARMLTPVGDLTKRETRAVARRLGLVTADKPESVDICFVPDDDYVGVLERHLPADAPALVPGPLVTAGGEIVGEHAGFARYTIGQRRGLPGGFHEPMYVVAIRPETREVVIGRGDELFGHTVALAEVNWLAQPLAPDDPGFVQCRYRAPAVPGRVRGRAGDTLVLALGQPGRAPTPGPSRASARPGRGRRPRCSGGAGGGGARAGGGPARGARGRGGGQPGGVRPRRGGRGPERAGKPARGQLAECGASAAARGL